MSSGKKAKGNLHNRLFWRDGPTIAVHDGDGKVWNVESTAGRFGDIPVRLKTDPAKRKTWRARGRISCSG